MRWINGRLGGHAERSTSKFGILNNQSLTEKTLLVVVAGLILLSAARSVEEKHVSVYSSVATYTLPVLERSGREYVGLLELLEPMGRVSSESNGHSLRLRYNAVDAEFSAGKTRARIHGRDFDLVAPFLIENSRGLVPLSSVSALLPRFLGTAVNYREGGRRLFIGEIGIQPSFRLDASTVPRIVLTFTSPVNPTISTEPGKLRMVFARDPVVSPGSQSITFDNKIITHASYSENNGSAEIDVAGNEPLMASFSGDRKTIVVTTVPQATNSTSAIPNAASPPTPSGSQNPAPTPAQALASANGTPGTTAASSTIHRPLAVIDPAHGGEERGAALTDRVAEKDVTLGFARLLRHELEMRGFAVLLLRDGDSGLTLDQRAAAANASRAGIYIGLHADSQGSGARVYTALLPVEGSSKGIFHAWNAAQAPVLPVSKVVSATIVAEMRKKDFSARASSASLRPMNNLSIPAVSVELAPGPNGIDDLTSANYQQRAAAAIADALTAIRDRLGVDR